MACWRFSAAWLWPRHEVYRPPEHFPEILDGGLPQLQGIAESGKNTNMMSLECYRNAFSFQKSVVHNLICSVDPYDYYYQTNILKRQLKFHDPTDPN